MMVKRSYPLSSLPTSGDDRNRTDTFRVQDEDSAIKIHPQQLLGFTKHLTCYFLTIRREKDK